MPIKTIRDHAKYYEIGIIALLSAVVCSFSYYFRGAPEIVVSVSHFYYLPIILSAFWWGKKGLVVSLILAAILIFGHIRYRLDVSVISNLIRSFMFIVVGLTSALLSEYFTKNREELKDSEEKYRMLTDNSLTGVYIHQDGRLVYVNKRFAEIHGYTREELLGMKHVLLVHPDEREEVTKRTKKRLAGEDAPSQYEIRRLKKNGETVWCRIMSIRVEFDQRPATMGNIIDITELKTAEVKLKKTLIELQETQDMLVQSETLSAIGQMTSGIAHEILNPVNIMSMKLQILEMSRELPPEIMEGIKTCGIQLSRITGIVKNIIHFSHNPERHMDMLPLNNVVDRVLSLCEAQLRVETIKTTVLYENDLPMIPLDRERIEQAVLNIFTNAITALKDQETKELKIETRAKPSPDNPEFVRLIISDTGPGIEKERLRKIFEPFYTTKKLGEGTGLGLYVSYGIVKDHGGRLWAENNESGGTSFIIEFPVIQEKNN